MFIYILYLFLDLNSSHWFTSQPLEGATLESMLTRILAVREVRTEVSKRRSSATAGGESLQWDGLVHIHFIIFSAGDRWLNYNERTFCHNAGQLQQLSDPLNCVGGTESSFHGRLCHIDVVRSPLWPVAGLVIINISFYVRTGSSDRWALISNRHSQITSLTSLTCF